MPTKGKDAAAPDPALAKKPEKPRTRPSEPNLAAVAKAAAKRPSEPNLAVLPKAPKPRPSSTGIPTTEPAKPRKPEAKRGELPAEWRTLVGKPLTCTWRRANGHPIEVIEWTARPDRDAWTDDVFGDCDPAKHFTGLIARKGEQVVWTSPVMLPVALLGQQLGEGRLEAVLLIDTATADSPIFAIEVDGTAIPAKKPQQIAANLAALKIEIVKPGGRAAKIDFETARPKLVAGALDGEGRKLLQKLSGDRDAGSAYLQPHVASKPRAPEGRDPRWIEALQVELAKSIVAASDELEPETHMLAGTLASFGPPAIPALVAALETALASYPKFSLDYGVQPVLLALDHLQSDAGVPPALAILAKAKAPEKSYAIPPVLDYLKPRFADPRIAPVFKKFYKKVAPKKPMHYIDDLEALAQQLDI